MQFLLIHYILLKCSNAIRSVQFTRYNSEQLISNDIQYKFHIYGHFFMACIMPKSNICIVCAVIVCSGLVMENAYSMTCAVMVTSGHAKKIAAEEDLAKNADGVVVVGGDGFFNEVGRDTSEMSRTD